MWNLLGNIRSSQKDKLVSNDFFCNGISGFHGGQYEDSFLGYSAL
jgi:hypothetical protein